MKHIELMSEKEFDRLRDIAPVCYIQMVLQTLIQYVMETYAGAALYDKDVMDLVDAIDAKLTKTSDKLDKDKVALIDKSIESGMFASVSSRANCELELVRLLGESITENSFYCDFSEEIPELKEQYQYINLVPTQKEVHKAFTGIKNQLYSLMAVKLDADGTDKLIDSTMTKLLQKRDQEMLDVISHIKLYSDTLNELMYYIEEDYGAEEIGSVDDVLNVCDELVVIFDEQYHTELSNQNLLDDDALYDAVDGFVMEIKNNPERAYAWVNRYDMFDPHHTVQNFVEGRETIKIYH